MKSQNLDIQFFKFVYSCIIVLYHLTASTAIECKGGYCGVEYFLLTAGLFLFLSFERGEKTGKQSTPCQYLTKRFWRFLPWSTTAFIAAVLVERVWINPTTSLVAWFDYFAGDIWELLMIKWNGMNNNTLLLNGPAWTLSAMLIIGFLIWTFMYYYKKLFLTLIMPLTLIIGFGYWMHLPSANTEAWIGFTTFGTFRTWLIMCLSLFCIPIAQKLADYPLNKKGKILLSIVEVLIHAVALVVIFERAQRYHQWMVTLLFMMSIAIALSGHSFLARFLEKSRIVRFLGELSMSIYLMHVSVIRVFRHLFDISAWSYYELLPLFVVLLAVAVAHYYGTKWAVRGVSDLWETVKRTIAVQENT